MIIYRLLTIIVLPVLHTMTNNLKEDSDISRDYIQVNVGKRIRMDCELNNSTIIGHRKGLWLRLEDAEVFFYSTSRIHSDQRFQIEQRTSLHMLNSTLSSEIITYSLIIDDVHLSDQGTYSCQSDNKIIKLFILNVVERPYFITHEYSTLLRTQIGENISMNCEAQGKPKPNLNWIKKIDGSYGINILHFQMLFPLENNHKMMINCSIISPSCQLNLLNVTRWHQGIYECVAMNIVGTIGRFYELDVQFPPDVDLLTEKSDHFIDDTVLIQCLIDANPEPDIRWLHRFPNEINQEMDLSRQFSQENFEDDGKKIWYIENEQLNATRWKTTLFIKRIPRRLFHSSFICRARNRHGQDEQSITIVEKYHHTTRSIDLSTASYNQTGRQLPSTTEFFFEATNDFPNRSNRISSYLNDLFIFEFYFFLPFLYI